MDLQTAHQIASDVFIQHNLSYVFISKLVSRSQADRVFSQKELNSNENAKDSLAAAAPGDGWELIPGSTETLVQFSFSKPSSTDPRPAIVVEMTLEFIGYNKARNLWRYLVRVEGQRFSRIIEVSGDGNKVTGAEFSEKWLDKVFSQKQVALSNTLWKKK